MRVIVFGATGKTGTEVWKRALGQGHQVTAFGRSVERLPDDEPGLSTFKGDAFEPAPVTEAVAGHDAVIVCIGSVNLKDKATLTDGTRNIVDAMVANDVRRLIVLSAAGVGDSWKRIPLSSKFAFKTFLRNVFADHRSQEALVAASPLDWTIVRAGVLTEAPGSGNYKVGNTESIGKISRADLAVVLVDQLADDSSVGEAISAGS